MGVVTHQPVADLRNDGWSLVGGLTSLNAILSNNTDSNYISCPSYKGKAQVTFPVDITSIPSGAVVTSVQVNVRCSTGSGSIPAGVTPSLTMELATSDDTTKWHTRTIYPTSTPTTFTVATFDRDALGVEWDVHRINQIIGRVFTYVAGVVDAIRCHEMTLLLNYRQAPTVAISGPSGDIYTSSPTISWIYNHADGDAMGGMNCKIFTASQVQDVTFDPNNTAPVFFQQLLGELASFVLPTSINPNDYWVYCQPISIFGAIGSWLGRLFHCQGPAPATPGVPDPTGNAPTGVGIIQVVPDVSLGSATLSVQDSSNMLSVQTADAETTTDGASLSVANGSVARDTSSAFYPGVGSWKLTSAAAGDMTLTTDWTEVSSQGSGQLTARCQFKAAASARSCYCQVQFFDANFGLISGTLTGSTITSSTTTYTEAVVTGAVPSGAIYARAAFVVQSAGAANEVHNLDHLGLAYGTSTPWSDGGHMSRNLLSHWYSTAEGTAGSGESWAAGSASTVSTATPPGTGGSGTTCNTMTYAGLTPSIAFRAAGTAFTSPTSGTNFTLNKPSGTTTGDLMVAFVTASEVVTMTPPVGWTLVDSTSVSGDLLGNETLFVLKRTATSSEPTSWTDGVVSASVSRRTAQVVGYSGAADASLQFIGETTASTANATPEYLTTPTVNNTDPNGWRLSAFVADDTASGGTLTANVNAPGAIPPISYVGVAPAWTHTSGGNGFTINKPSSVANGDFMVATLQITGNVTVTAPTGWTLQWSGAGTGGPSTMAVMTRFAGASEPSSWTGSVSGTTYQTAVTQCAAYRNVNSGTPFIAQNGLVANNANSYPTPSVTNNNALAWRLCSFASCTTTTTGSFTSTEISERADNRATYNSFFHTESSTLAIYDSNGNVSTGTYTETGTFDQSGYSGGGWIGLLNPLSSPPSSAPNETSRSSATTGGSNPFIAAAVYDSAGVVATGSQQVTGIWSGGSGSWNSSTGWLGIIRPASPVVSGYVSASMASLVDVSKLANPFDGSVTVTASFIGSTSGTPYLTAYFYRANQLISSAVQQGVSFGTSLWQKSAATYSLPDGTTRMKVGVAVSNRSVSDVVYFDRVSLAYGTNPVFRPGTSRAARPIWAAPHIQYADDDGSGYGRWADLPGSELLNPAFDPLSGILYFTDHTVIPLVNRKYRARTLSYGLAGDLFTSSWGPESSEFSFVAENWWLKDIANPANNIQLYVRWDKVSVATSNTAVVFQPLGTQRPVVLTEGYKGEVFSLSLVPVRAEMYGLLKAMLKSRRTLFLQSDTDAAWWVRPFGDLATDILPTNGRQSDPIREIKVQFVEVDPLA